MHAKMHKHKAEMLSSLQWPEAAIESCDKTLYRKFAATKTGACLHVCVSWVYECLVQTLNRIPSCAYTEPCSKINTLLHFKHTAEIRSKMDSGPLTVY